MPIEAKVQDNAEPVKMLVTFRTSRNRLSRQQCGGFAIARTAPSLISPIKHWLCPSIVVRQERGLKGVPKFEM